MTVERKPEDVLRGPGTVVDRLAQNYEWMVGRVQKLRAEADQLTVEADRLRRKADAFELDAVEALTAANALREIGIRVDRDPDGVPRVQVNDRAPEAHSLTGTAR